MAASVLLVTVAVFLSVEPARVFTCAVSKCCPLGEEILDGQCTNSTRETIHNSSLTLQVTSIITCVNWSLITDPHRYLENCNLLLEETNQTLNRTAFCVEWVNSTYLPFKCKDSVELHPVEIARNRSTEIDDSTPNPSEYWWYDTSHSKLKVSNMFPVRKCCPQHEILSNGECIQSFDNRTSGIFKSLEFISNIPCPFGKKIIDRFDPGAFIQNGTLLLPKYPQEHPELCVDWVESVQDFRTFYCLACEEAWTEVVNSSLSEELVDGSLLVREDRTYNVSEWWRDSNSSAIKACVCNHQACVRKCCSADKLMNLEGSCASTNDSLNSSYMNNYKLIPRDPCRSGRYMLYPDEDEMDTYKYLRNGSIVLTNLNNLLLTNSEYCVDRMDAEGEFYAFPCFPEDSGEMPETRYTLYPVGMLISEPFLLATMLVYGVVPELRNLHGLSLMSHVSSLFLAYLVLPVVQLAGNDLSDDMCRTLAFIIYFSFLASFFWLNVMCLDIWWTFSGFRPLRGSVKEREHKKFIIYSLYSWGCPLIMLIVAIVMDLHPDISNDYIKPNFGEKKCWFDLHKSALCYFVGPIAFLLVCNIVLFIFTAIRIRQLKNETKILQRKDSKRHDDDDNNRQRFNLYLKLFLVMGVNWIMEIISWFAGGPDYLWYVTDIGNTLQGVLIFIIFVWKDRVRRLLMERFCPKRDMSGTAKSVVTSTRSITRNSPSRTNTLNTRTQERNSNHEDYRMKPLMETSCTEVP